MAESAGPRRTLILLRHGRTAWNAAGRAQGHADVSLDDVGLAQARAAARSLAGREPARLWSSDLARARETADQLGALTGLPVETSEAFREYSVGERVGLTVEEFAQRFPQEYAGWRAGRRTALGAESDEDVLARFVPALESSMAALEPGACGIVVSHGAALKTALLAVLDVGGPARDAFAGLGNCHWVELAHSSSTFLGGGPRWRLTGYNLSAAGDWEPGAGGAPDFASVEPVG